MHYHPLLDTAPSSVASTILTLIGSVLSALGSVYMIHALYRMRCQDSFSYWRTRHYLIFMLALTHLAMSVSSLISLCFFLVFGRLALTGGCTISGMTEYWSQQAVDLTTLVMAWATLASVYRSEMWIRHRHWIQTNIAPIFGVILFLPLVTTIVTQIVWRFRSSEYGYCWVPRMPVYARWVAVDAWRSVLVLGLIVSFVYLAYWSRRGQKQLMISWPLDVPGSPHGGHPIESRIMGEGASRAVDAPGRAGLFSTSMHNVQRWAVSRLFRSNADNHALNKSRATTSSSADSDMSRHGESQLAGSSIAKTYYGLFKRSLTSLVRRFIITTDIPSPTFSQNMFDQIGHAASNPILAELDVSGLSRCNFCTSSSTATPCRGRLEHQTADSSVSRELHERTLLRRWYSALTSLLTLRTQASKSRGTTATLRRLPTVAALEPSGMPELCDCAAQMPQGFRSADTAAEGLVQEQHQTLTMLPYKDSDADSLTNPCDTEKKPQGPNDLAHPAHANLSAKIHRLFGSTLVVQPPPVAAIYHVNVHHSSSSENRTIAGLQVDSPVVAHTVASSRTNSCYIKPQEAAGAGSLEENIDSGNPSGRWAMAVEKCRQDRHLQPTARVSRLYVYPLAYVAIWLPSIAYWMMSTYVYYRSFQQHAGKDAVSKRMVHFSGLPAEWTESANMNRAWPYFVHAAPKDSTYGRDALVWMVVVQAVHMLGGAVNAVLFWITERQ
ncbi:hypothetical protein GGI07_001133 [Coemansia sp. Benny D115]|nr:hypothetical protein GGI07_001133 [Coemansia sp. Benny D115]